LRKTDARHRESTDSKISGTEWLVNAGTHCSAGRLSLTHYTTHLSNIPSSAAVVSVATHLSQFVAPVVLATITWPYLLPAASCSRTRIRKAQPASLLPKVRTFLPEHQFTSPRRHQQQHPRPHPLFARAHSPSEASPPSTAFFATLSLTAIAVAVLPWAQHFHAAFTIFILATSLLRAPSHRIERRVEARLHTLHDIHFIPSIIASYDYQSIRLPNNTGRAAGELPGEERRE
jgi:hypothetical protein